MPDMHFTPTELRMLAVLNDGQSHGKGELIACLWDEEASQTAVDYHLSNLRKKLNRIGHHIVCEARGKYMPSTYRRVRLLGSIQDLSRQEKGQRSSDLVLNDDQEP